MDNTEQLRFTAQYVHAAPFSYKYVDSQGTSIGGLLTPERLGRLTTDASVEHYHLLLKPLVSISFEDWMSTSEILNPNFRIGPMHPIAVEYLSKPGQAEEFAEAFTSFQQEIPKKPNPVQPLRVVACIDYLRSKGYLVPWGLYTVDEILSKGWVQLQDV